MEFEEQAEEMAIETESYDSLGISTRVKMPGSGGPGEILSAQPVRNNNFINHTSTNINSNNGNGNNNNSSSNKPRYRECLKNHAVGMGGHALDGCGEFMPAGAEGTLDGLKCAACNCHRNFHRKETDTGGVVGVGFGIGPTDPYLLTHHPPPQFAPYYRTPAGYLHVGGQQRAAMLALPSTSGGGGGGGTQSTRELDQEDVSNPSSGSGSKKRFRTKFSQEQKEKLLDLAEKLGWRIQKHDEAVVQQFCTDYGVKRHVLKVWMHNNKHTLGKKP